MRSFDIPEFYRSPIISRVKAKRKALDPRKQDFTPTELDFGKVRIRLARHFGFCFGVENAIEISYKAVDENPGKRIFLLSQMIHNPEVNADFQSRGVQFLHDTLGNELVPLDTLGADDVVIVPAFGATVELERRMRVAGCGRPEIQHHLSVRRKGVEAFRPAGSKHVHRGHPRQTSARRNPRHLFPCGRNRPCVGGEGREETEFLASGWKTVGRTWRRFGPVLKAEPRKDFDPQQTCVAWGW